MTWYDPTTWGKSKEVSNERSGDLSFPTGIPEKVFVESIDPGPAPASYAFGTVGSNYEYSEAAPAGSWDIDDLLCGPYGRSNFITLFYALPEIFAPVNEIASRVADAVWELKSVYTDQVDYKNANFNKLFSNPNPLMTHKQLVWQSVCYYILTGANFQVFNKPSTLPDEFDSIVGWMNAPTTKVKIKKNTKADPYTATDIKDFISSISSTEGGYDRPFDIQNVLPFLKLDLAEGNQVDKFKSDLMGAKMAIKNLIPVYEARGVIYIKRGALGFIVSKKSDESGNISLTKSEKEEAQREYQGTYGLRGDKHTVGVASAPLEYVATGMSIKDLEPFRETLQDALSIYGCLRVPKHFIPNPDHSTFNNAQADTIGFYDDVIIPLAKMFAQAWTAFFGIPNRYIEPSYKHIAALQENLKEKSDVDSKNGSTYLLRWQNGVITLNDWIMAIDGNKGTGAIYEKKIFDLTPEEQELAKNIINLFKGGNTNNTQNEATPENQGTQAQSGAN